MAKKVPAAYKGPMGKGSYKYREQYGVIVTCKSEGEQRAVFEALSKSGHKCRVVTV